MPTKAKKKYNRIKIVLVEKEKSNKWVADKLGLTAAAVSRWCTNDAQPTLETLFRVAQLLGVRVCDLINEESNKKSA